MEYIMSIVDQYRDNSHYEALLEVTGDDFESDCVRDYILENFNFNDKKNTYKEVYVLEETFYGTLNSFTVNVMVKEKWVED